MSTRAWLILLAVGLFAIGTDGYVIAGLLPEMGRDLGVSDSDTGHLVSAFALAYAIGAPLFAVMLGNLPGRLVLISSLTVFVAANVAAALADSYGTMIVIRVLAGLAAAVFSPGAMAVVPSLVPAEQRGRALGTVSAGIAISTAVGVPLGTLIGNAFSWRTTFLAVAALGALACLGLVLLLPPLPPNPPADLRTRVAASRTAGVPSALCVTVLWIAGAFTLLTYLSPVLDEVGNVHGTTLSIWLAIYGLAAVTGNHLGGRAARPLSHTAAHRGHHDRPLGRARLLRPSGLTWRARRHGSRLGHRRPGHLGCLRLGVRTHPVAPPRAAGPGVGERRPLPEQQRHLRRHLRWKFPRFRSARKRGRRGGRLDSCGCRTARCSWLVGPPPPPRCGTSRTDRARRTGAEPRPQRLRESVIPEV